VGKLEIMPILIGISIGNILSEVEFSGVKISMFPVGF